MSYQITLSPSGRGFVTEPGETILEGALRAGLSVQYQCANGSCGDCRARLLEGNVADNLHHDYVFKGTDRQYPMLLMCCARPAGDMIIEAAEAATADDIPHQRITTSVVKLERLQQDVMLLQLRTPRSQTLWFLAGQYVSLQAEGQSKYSKSIASCPCHGRELQFHFRHRQGDAFSDYVFEQLKLRDEVVIEGPHGSFVLDEHSVRPLIFITYDTGFSAIKSLIEHAISLETACSISLYWFTAHAGDHYLENYCRAWQGALDNFNFELVVAVQDAEVFAAHLLAVHPDLADYDIYLSVPDALSPALQQILLAHGADSDHMLVHGFD